MKIFVAAYEPGRTGGGWSFADNFVKGMGDLITQDYNEADIYFIPSPSMVQRDDVQRAKNDGKKIVLRLDNAVRNSRNRNTGMTRMKDFHEWSDLVVFQSEWAKDYLAPFLLHRDSYDKTSRLAYNLAVISNGVDLGLYKEVLGEPNFVLYSRFNRDETKNWEVARYWFSQYQLENNEAYLHIVGQFSPELVSGNFDFYNQESYKYYGVTSHEAMASLYQVCGKFLYTYYNDACSNSLIEALASGCEIVGDEYYRQTGGAKEIIHKFSALGREYFSLDRMCGEYKEALGKL